MSGQWVMLGDLLHEVESEKRLLRIKSEQEELRKGEDREDQIQR